MIGQRPSKTLFFMLLIGALLLAGCGDSGGSNSNDDDANTDTSGDATDPDSANPDGTNPDQNQDSTGDLPPGACTYEGLNVDTSSGTYNVSLPSWVAYLQNPGEPWDAISIELYSESAGPGTITLTDENYATCLNCVRAERTCTEADGCVKDFLATEGELEITAIGGGGEQFAGTARNLRMVEVTIDPSTYESTPVPGGEVWCVDELPFDVIAEGTNAPVPECDPMQEPLTITQQTAVQDPDSGFGEALFYNGYSSDTFPRDWLSIELFTQAGGPSEPGTYPIRYSSYADCLNCVLVGTGCSQDGTCDSNYLAVSGEMEITEIANEAGGGNFTATLRNVELYEHDIDFEGVESTPVDNGASFCIDEIQVTAPVTAP